MSAAVGGLPSVSVICVSLCLTESAYVGVFARGLVLGECELYDVSKRLSVIAAYVPWLRCGEFRSLSVMLCLRRPRGVCCMNVIERVFVFAFVLCCCIVL